jgi:Kyakuja-Dileera-Zisupton transposase
MDFIVFFSLISSILHYFVFSYDIVCQWFRNLSKRHSQFPNNIRLSPQQLNKSVFVIPKFHIYAHRAKCQSVYSLNFLPFMGWTNGEDPERWWAHINPVSMSTKEMGPGGRSDTIDDHVCAWNWRKITGFGKCDRSARSLFIDGVRYQDRVYYLNSIRRSRCGKASTQVYRV